jgi:hypothetical protein
VILKDLTAQKASAPAKDDFGQQGTPGAPAYPCQMYIKKACLKVFIGAEKLYILFSTQI